MWRPSTACNLCKLIGASTFALIDTCYFRNVMIDGNKDNHKY